MGDRRRGEPTGPGVAGGPHRISPGRRRHAGAVRDRVDDAEHPDGGGVVSDRIPAGRLGAGLRVVSRHARGRRLGHQRHDVAERGTVGHRPVEFCAVAHGRVAGSDGRLHEEVGARTRGAVRIPPHTVGRPGGGAPAGRGRAGGDVSPPHRCGSQSGETAECGERAGDASRKPATQRRAWVRPRRPPARETDRRLHVEDVQNRP
mmetsp:Transcript_390/g.900  ORF Transcript_390/g.900 Transcript_390/m.900 type:complete len:204 (-) Transcript_390:191-802(-)